MKEKVVQTVEKPKKKRVTLDWLLKNEMPIWVRNTTEKKAKRNQESGIMVLQTGYGDNFDKLFIPPGNDPICLTDQVDRESLKRCKDLFRAIDRGGLELLDPEMAEDYYVQNEQRKAIVAQKITNIIYGEKKDDYSKKFDSPEKANASERKVEKLHPKVEDLCLQARSGKLKEVDALESLLEQESSFKEADLAYLKNNCVFGGVKQWATQKLDTLKTKTE